MWRVVFAGALAGCNSLLGIHDLHDDAPTGDSIATIDGMACFGSGGFLICLSALPSQPQTPSGAIDTDTSGDCFASYSTPPGNPWCVIAGTSVTVTDTVTATGRRPLVLLATGDVAIAGTVDASSHGAAMPTTGPAAQTTCAGGIGSSTATADMGGGGGAGGSFATSGGAGGDGDTSTHGNPIMTMATPATLQGGCAGGAGAQGGPEMSGDPCEPTPSGAAGPGGGAVMLVAGGSLKIDGHVAANGAGGGPGVTSRGGGSGGGAGGLIVLWAGTSLAGGGTLVASGGGGGGGGNHCANGAPGGDPALDAITPAPGGAGGAAPNNGGDGAAITDPGGTGVTGGSKGGGGGGGGVGFVLVHASTPFDGSVSGLQASF
jgi:hypothetical protein